MYKSEAHTFKGNKFLWFKLFPSNDPHLAENSEECMPFSHSAPPCGSGNTGQIFGASTIRQQMNTLTAFLDAGQVYGSDHNRARLICDFNTDEGLLKVNQNYTDNGCELLAFVTMGANMCATRLCID